MSKPVADKPAKKPRKTKLTDKQRKLIKGVAEGKTQKEAAKSAGLSEAHASVCLNMPKVQETLQQMMAKHGLDDASLLNAHRELISATKVISAVNGTDANNKTMDFIDVPDFQARAKGLEMAYKLKGAFIEKKEITGKDGGPLEHRHHMTDDELLAVIQS